MPGRREHRLVAGVGGRDVGVGEDAVGPSASCSSRHPRRRVAVTRVTVRGRRMVRRRAQRTDSCGARTVEPMAIDAAPAFLDPTHLLNTFGLIGIMAVIFAECGLLVGFFLPGDSLLFTAGLLAPAACIAPLWVLLIVLPLAAIAGNLVGYWIGYRAGPAVFNKPDSRLFKAEYVEPVAAPSSSSTAPARSCWPASCRSCGPSPRSWPAPPGWTSGATRSTR